MPEPASSNDESEIGMVVRGASDKEIERAKAKEKRLSYVDSDIGAESVFEDKGSTVLGLYATNNNNGKELDKL